MEKLAAGLNVIAKYGDEYDVYTNYGVVYAGAELGYKMSSTDREAMVAAGWRWDVEHNCYAFYVQTHKPLLCRGIGL